MIKNFYDFDTPETSFVGSYKDFFAEDMVMSKEEHEKKLKDLLNYISEHASKLNKFKRGYLTKQLGTMYLYRNYYEYFENRYGKEVYRFVGKDSDIDEFMEEDAMKVRASIMTSITDSYGSDAGFVDYWSFKDAIVFKTIKRLKFDL